MGINYGWNKVRYTAPVPAGARIRASLETLSVDEVGDGWYQLVQKWTVEIEGQEKPACFAESVVRLLDLVAEARTPRARALVVEVLRAHDLAALGSGR